MSWLDKPGRQSVVLPVLAVLVFATATSIYWPSLGHPFQFDDRLFLIDSNVQQGRWATLLWPPSPRLLTWLSFLLQYEIHGPQAGAYHAVNVLLHGLVSVVFFFLLRSIFHSAGRTVPLTLLVAATLVFAFHPVQTEPVLYIYQRSTLLGALFSFLAIIAHLKGRLGLTWLFFLMGLVCKEFVAGVPLCLWAADGFLRKQWRPNRWVTCYLLVALFASLAFFAWVIITEEETFGWTLSESGLYAATQAKVIWSYVVLVLVPHPLNLDRDVKVQENLADPVWWLALGGFVIVLHVVVRIRNTHPLVALFAAFFFAFLLPSSSFFPSRDYMFEHRVYASVGAWAGLLCLAASALGSRNPSGLRAALSVRRGLVAIFFAGLLLTYALLDVKRQNVWSEEVTLWGDTAGKSPRKYRPIYNLGVSLMERSPNEAIQFLSRAVEIDPAGPLAYRSLGQVYFNRGDQDAAEQLWMQALLLDPGHAETLLSLGKLYLRKHDYLRATKYLEKAQRADPRHWEPYYYLGQLNLQFGFLEKAIRHCEQGLDRYPLDSGLRFLLADVVSQTQNWSRAAELYAEGLKRNPKHAPAYYKLGRAYWNMGERTKALRAIEQGLAVAASTEEVSIGESLLRTLVSPAPPGSDRPND